MKKSDHFPCLVLLGLAAFVQSAQAQPSGTFVPTGRMIYARGNYTATLLRDGRVLIAGGGNGAAEVLASAEIFDPSTGTFTPTGSMNNARAYHTAALLQDGRVLIAGGWGDPRFFEDDAFMLTSAEIYDPAKGTFELTGSLPAEYDPLITSVLLKDGRVLVGGGPWALGLVAVYDPGTGQFSPLGNIPLVLSTATLLADGRVLLVGTTSDGKDNIALIYDPAAGTFNPTGSQIPYSIFANQASAPTTGFGAALLADDNVLLVGGGQGSGGASRTAAEIYDPSIGAFRQTGSLPAVLPGPTATTLRSGQVLVGGGKDAALYNPASGTFSSLSPIGSWGSTATLLLDGTVLIAGAGSTQTDTWLYVPAPSIGVDRTSLSFTDVAGPPGTQTIAITNTGGGDLQWNVATSAPWLSVTPSGGTNSGTVNVTASAAILSAGTYSASVTIVAAASNAPVIIPVTFAVSPALSPGAFTATGNMNLPQQRHSATLLPNGKVLITPGTGTSTFAELYDPATRTFTVTGGMATAGGIATLLGNGKVLITGNTAQLYDPVTDSFAPTGSYIGPFYYGDFYYPDTATLLPDGRVLIVGSNCGDCFFEHEELYDPVTGTFKVAGQPDTLDSRRTLGFGHTATLLPNGKVLLAGGDGEDSGYFSAAELYDSSTDTFTATGNMTIARAGQTATLLPDGTVLIAGGVPFGGGASAEVYNPAAGTFSSTGNMTTPRNAHTATLLPDGTVLLAGGQSYAGSANADIYNPATGMFSSTGNMATPRFWQAATLLQDGTVLMTGGGTNAGVALASAEIYTPLSLIPVPLPMLLSLSGDGDGGTWIAELYDPTTGAFSSTGNMTAGRERATATLLPDGTVLIANDDGGTSAELYNFATGSFSRTGSMTTPVYLNTATLLNDGSVLIAGAEDPQTIPSAEIYTPSVLVPAPVLLVLPGDGKGQGAIQHAGTTRIASAGDPAVPGEYLSIYLTGLADGSVIPPQVAIGGRLAEIMFFGNVPGSPGLNVVNIRVPSGVTSGPAVPVRLTYLGRPSNQVTIGVSEVALQQAVAAMKTAAGTDNANVWQWAWYWQNLPPFSGAPAGFGVIGSISPDVMSQIIVVGGGDPLRNISAEQWVAYFRQVVPQ